jgi:hypothetical protein
MSNNKQSSSIDWILDWIEDVDLTPELWEKIKKQAKEKYEHEMCVFADEYASYVLEQSKPGIKGAMVSMCAWTFFKNRRNEQQ